jgi:hypothetical protein
MDKKPDITKAMTEELYAMMRKRTGLYILDPPTGSSKSHSMYQAIARYLVDTEMKGRPILFLTPQKKNLDWEKQKTMYLDFFPEDREAAAKRFDAAFQWLDNKMAYLSLLSEQQEGNILDEIPADVKATEEFDQLQKALHCQQELQGPGLIAARSASVQEQLESMLRNKVDAAEFSFRKKLKHMLEEKWGIQWNRTAAEEKALSSQKGAHAMSLQMLKKKAPWLQKLYPGTFLLDKKLIFMSFDKFCYGNITLASALRDFWTLFDDKEKKEDPPILIIDELDSTHPVCENFLLTQAMSQRQDLIHVFDTLHRRMAAQEYLPKHITELKSVKSGQYSMDKLLAKADDIYKEYNLNLDLKYDGADEASLFSSSYYFTTGHSYSYMKADHERNNMLIHIVDYAAYEKFRKQREQDGEDCLYPTWLIRALWRFVIRFRSCLYQWALEYKEDRDKEARKKFQEERAAAKYPRDANHPHALLLEDACRSILDALRISAPLQQNILMPQPEQMQLRYHRKSSKKNPLRDLKEHISVQPYFSAGYQLTTFLNAYSHYERTKISFFSKPCAAEGFLCHLAKRFMVIGLSATARVPSLSNYFLPYLQESLTDSFYPMSEGLRQSLRTFYDALAASYQKNQIHIHTKKLCDTIENQIPEDQNPVEWERFLRKFYQTKESEGIREALAREICAVIDACGGMNSEGCSYIVHRYVEMLDGLHDFYQAPTSHAWLYLNTILPHDKDPRFDEALLKKFKEGFDAEFPARTVEFYVLRSKGQDGTSFTEARNKIRKALKGGLDVIVFSAYNSVGVGIDLDYDSTFHQEDFVDVYPDDPHIQKDARHRRRDFDGFVLGDINYLLENVFEFEQEKDAQQKEWRRHRLLSTILALEEMDQITYWEGNKAIRDLLETKMLSPLLGKRFQEFQNRPYVMGQVQYKLIQALGRGNRAFCKNRNIYIVLSRKNMESLRKAESAPVDMIHTPEWSRLLQFVSQYDEIEQLREKQQREHEDRAAVNHCYCEETILREMLSFSFIKDMAWTDDMRHIYELLGRMVMCFPTFDDIEIVIERMHLDEEDAALVRQFSRGYINFGKKLDAYQYLRSNQSKRIYPFCGKNVQKARQAMYDRGDATLGRVSAEEARLTFLFQRVPGLKAYFEEMGFATSFKRAQYLMCPTLFTNFYKGRLGEIAGTWILKNYGHIEVNPITENSYYEFFDAMIEDGYSMIDFKNWKLFTGMYYVNRSQFYNKVQEKLERIQDLHPGMGMRAYIIRLCQTSDDDALLKEESLLPLPEDVGKNIETITNLVNENGVNMEALYKIKQLEAQRGEKEIYEK